MKKYYTNIIIFLLCVFYTHNSFAWIIKDASSGLVSTFIKSSPDWIKKNPKEDINYKYYVGRASQAKTEAEGIKLATKDAYEQALRMNFGTEFSFNSEILQTTENVLSQTNMLEKSRGSVRFEDFELTDQYIEEDKDKWNVWVLYRFSKTAIDKEKERLKNLPQEESSDLDFSIQGSSSDSEKGILEIVTQPKGIAVRIDGEAYGRTPLKLVGQLELGMHKLQLNNDFYETEEQDILIIPNKTTRITKVMRPATATISVETVPPMANIIIDGKPAGISPVKNFNVEAGKTIKIEATHSEAFKIVQERSFFKNTEETVRIEMQAKPAMVSFDSSISGVDVYIDGNLIGTTPIEKHNTTAGKHNIIFRKKGFSDKSDIIELRGGENFVYPIFNLTSLSEEEKIRQLEAIRRQEMIDKAQRRSIMSPWTFNIGGSSLGKTNKEYDNGLWGLELQLSKRFHEFIGIRVSGFYGSDSGKKGSEEPSWTRIGDYEEENIKNNKTYDLNMGIPLYITLSRQKTLESYSYPLLAFYFGPEIGITKSEFTHSYKKGSRTRTCQITHPTFGCLSWGPYTINETNINTDINLSQQYIGYFAGFEINFTQKNYTTSGLNLEFSSRKYKEDGEFEGNNPHVFRISYFVKF